jgi:hypothetical protein
VEDVRCNLYWERDTCLLIGWFDSVMLLEIKGGAGGRQIGTVMEFKVGPDQGTKTHRHMYICVYITEGTEGGREFCTLVRDKARGAENDRRLPFSLFLCLM